MKFILAYIFCLAAIAPVFCQTFVSGVVKDQNNALIPAARVSIGEKSVLTNADGEFRIEAADNQKKVVVVAAGFERKEVLQAEASLIILEVSVAQVSVTAEIGSRIDRDLVPQSVTLVSNQEIQQRATFGVAQVAKEEAGINIQRTSPTLGGIYVRGLAGKNVNVFVDGVRFTNSAQRGGINTFLNLNEPSSLQSVEVLRGASAAQYGSDSIGGTVSFLSRAPAYDGKLHGEFSSGFASADRSFGNSGFLSFGNNKFGGFVNVVHRKINDLRSARGIDTHSAVTRFLGLSSKIYGDRNPDTGFSNYGGSARLNYAPDDANQFSFFYQRSQQDGGKRHDQLIGGDGNLIADLRNLMLDFGYLRYTKSRIGFFDSGSFTLSYNSQREERVNQGGQGNPFADITHQYERTTTLGGSFFLNKEARNVNFLFGGDLYHDKINSPAFTFSPSLDRSFLSRPRVPDEARFISAGLFIQNAWEFFDQRFRISGALRYGVASYRARAEDSPIVNNQRLWADDSLKVGDFSGRIGAVIKIDNHLRFAFNYSRGFRYPSMTDLGTLGLTGDGFEVDYTTAIGLGGLIGTTADASAISTGLSVGKQRSEISNSYDFSIRWQDKRIETDLTFFQIDLEDTITKQSLILPLGSIGRRLGDQVITSQLPNGVVFVPLSTSPVLVRSNFTAARLRGLEYELEANIYKGLSFKGNFTYVHSADRESGLPPNIEGGTPPPTGFAGLKYTGKRFWIEAYSILANRQERLSSLDLSDRRTGATRSRAQIQNFFSRGACVRGLTNNPDGRCGSGDESILLATGETLAQVQNRVLGSANSAPLFKYLPGYGLVNLRGNITLAKNVNVFLAFENILDKIHRNPSWGIDGAGRNLSLQFRYKF